MDYDKVFGKAEQIMPMRHFSAPLLRDAALRGEAIGLPQTATPAEALALSGLTFLLLGLAVLIAFGRVRRAGA